MKLATSERFSEAVVAELKKLRTAKGISQKTLADHAGLTRGAITHIEAGIRNPSLVVCHALASALGISLSTVIRRAEKAWSSK